MRRRISRARRSLILVVSSAAAAIAPTAEASATTPPDEDPQAILAELQGLEESFIGTANEQGMVISAAGCSVDGEEATCYGRNGASVVVGTQPVAGGESSNWALKEFVDPSTTLDREAITANAYGQGIDVSGCPLPPSISEPVTLDCPVVNGDGSEGTWTVTVNPDNSVTEGSYVETKAATVHVDIDSRTWELIGRDPDAHTGELIRVYGHVTQADSATGTDAIRANIDGEPHDDWYDYDVNTILTDLVEPNALATVVNGDLFVAEVTVVGSFTYDTSIGGSMTVPMLSVDSLTVTGHEG